MFCKNSEKHTITHTNEHMGKYFKRSDSTMMRCPLKHHSSCHFMYKTITRRKRYRPLLRKCSGSCRCDELWEIFHCWPRSLSPQRRCNTRGPPPHSSSPPAGSHSQSVKDFSFDLHKRSWRKLYSILHCLAGILWKWC